MNTLGNGIEDARRRVSALISIARWIWIINLIVMIGGIMCRRYDLSALAGFTWVLSLVAAAVGNRAERNLGVAEQTIRQL